MVELVPNIAFVVGHTVTLEKQPKFLLEGDRSMMLSLFLDVIVTRFQRFAAILLSFLGLRPRLS